MKKIGADGIITYLETYHHALEDAASKHLRPEHRRHVRHLSFLPARVLVYDSSVRGCGYEYRISNSTSFDVIEGDKPVEEMLFVAPNWFNTNRRGIRISDAGRVTIRHSKFKDLFPMTLLGNVQRVEMIDVYVIFSGHKSTFSGDLIYQHIRYAELSTVRTDERWSAKAAISRANGEIAAANADVVLSDNLGVSIGDFINGQKQRSVLVLGDYGKRGRLEAICEQLRKLGYAPFLVEDIPDEPCHNLTQKVSALSLIARFVVVEDSTPAGQIAEIQICQQNYVPTLILRLEGHGSTRMTAGVSVLSRVTFERTYREDTLDAQLSLGIARLEKERERMAEEYEVDDVYPWRVKETRE